MTTDGDERRAVDVGPITTLEPSGIRIAFGRAPMYIPAGGKVARKLQLSTPRSSFREAPTTLLTISGNANADPYAVYGVHWQIRPDILLCTISAQATVNPRDEDYFCEFLLIGRG